MKCPAKPGFSAEDIPIVVVKAAIRAIKVALNYNLRFIKEPDLVLIYLKPPTHFV